MRGGITYVGLNREDSVTDLDSFGKLFNICNPFNRLGVVSFQLLENGFCAVIEQEADGNFFAPKASRASDSMQVRLGVCLRAIPVGGQIVVDDGIDCQHIDATTEQVGGDEYARGSSAKFVNDAVSLLGCHVATVQHRHSMYVVSQPLRERVGLMSGAHKDDALPQRKQCVNVGQNGEALLLFAHVNVVLFDLVKRQGLSFNRNLQHLHVPRQVALDSDGLIAHAVQIDHLVGLVQHENHNGRGGELALLDKLHELSGRAHQNVLANDAQAGGGSVLAALLLGGLDCKRGGGAREVAQRDVDVANRARELPGGHEAQRLRGEGVGIDARQHSQHEGGGLPEPLCACAMKFLYSPLAGGIRAGWWPGSWRAWRRSCGRCPS
ncbi:poly-A RNA export protein DBP5 [Gracilaria domingensis]|nr:poly-A RNA export protein DBP5 [Gracilaria domingensis]